MADAEKKEKKHHHKTSSKENSSKVDKKGSTKDKKDKDKKEKKSSKSQSNSMAALPDMPAANGSSLPVPAVPADAGGSPSSTLLTVPGATSRSAPAPDTADAANNAKLDVCSGCGKNIMGDISHAMNKKWHIYCFVCTTCSAPVSDEYYETDGRPYCRKDFNKSFGASCAGCKKQLVGKKLKALDKEWHPACFVCGKCKKPFPEMEYYDIDGNPYCGPCYDQEEEKLSKLAKP